MSGEKSNKEKESEELTGYALTKHLETDPEFMALLLQAKGGWHELPEYNRVVFLQSQEKRARSL